jgi:hypothetical protein
MLAAIAAFSALACSDNRASHRGTLTAAGHTAAARGGVPGAEQALDVYLAASIEGAPDPRRRDSLDACPPDGAIEPIYTLAAFRILSSSASHPDAAEVLARVTTVAQESGDPHVANRKVAVQRVQVDTLHWTVIRNPKYGRWSVCGISREGVDFGHYGSDSNTTWTPPGASWRAVHALADSIRRQ